MRRKNDMGRFSGLGAGLGRMGVMAVLIVAMTVGMGMQAFSASWYDGDWSYRRKVAIAGDLAPSTLTDFPLLVQITNSTDAVFSHAMTSGDDILFTAEDGTTLLDFELEYYTNATTPRLTAIRVKLNLKYFC